MVKRKLNNKRGGKVYVAYIDYKKALDTVDRENLWETPRKLKTSSKMVNMLKSMYPSAQACVRWGFKLIHVAEKYLNDITIKKNVWIL